MRTTRATNAPWVTLLIALIAFPTAALAAGPMATVKKTQAKIDKLLAQKKTPASDKKLKQTVNRFLDFRDLARRALGKHWKKRSPAEQKEFVSILQKLIERNYLKQARKNTGHHVDYRGETLKGKKAKVTTAIKVKKRRRVEEILVVYKMHRRHGHWVVYDVVTDDVSIVRNYRSQFNRIIKKKSYQHLVNKMRKKLAKTS